MAAKNDGTVKHGIADVRGSLVSSAATTSNLLVGLLFTLAPLVFILSERPLPES